MLVIRFFRTGKKNQTAFKIVVTDKRKSSTRGRFVEEVGFYNPQTKEKVLRQDRIKHWLSVGAKPSSTVHNLFISEKIIEGKKIDVHKKPKKKKGEEAAPAEGATPAEALKPAEAPVAAPVETPVVEEKKEELAKEPEKPAEKAPQKAEPQPSEEKKIETPKTE